MKQKFEIPYNFDIALIDKNIIEFDLPAEFTAVKGKCIAEFHIIKVIDGVEHVKGLDPFSYTVKRSITTK